MTAPTRSRSRAPALPEAFTVKPSATAGRVIFDRLATPGPGPFNLDIGTTETLDLNASGGDDSLATEVGTGPGFKLDVSGGDGNDALDAGDAPTSSRATRATTRSRRTTTRPARVTSRRAATATTA